MEFSARPNTSSFTDDQPRGRRRPFVDAGVERTTMVGSDQAVWRSNDDSAGIYRERRTCLEASMRARGEPQVENGCDTNRRPRRKEERREYGGRRIRAAILRAVGHSPCGAGEAVGDLIAGNIWADRTMDTRFSQWVKWLFCVENGRNALTVGIYLAYLLQYY